MGQLTGQSGKQVVDLSSESWEARSLHLYLRPSGLDVDICSMVTLPMARDPPTCRHRAQQTPAKLYFSMVAGRGGAQRGHKGTDFAP